MANCDSSSSTSHAAAAGSLSTLKNSKQQPGTKYGSCSGSKVAVRASVDNVGFDAVAIGEEDTWNLCGWEEGPSVVRILPAAI